MSEQMINPDMEKDNQEIASRDNVFYWQTDRAVSPEDAGAIWADRHRYFSDKELIDRVNAELTDKEVVQIEQHNNEAQTNLGNVNSVREARLDTGQSIIIRSHPKGIKNGYFHAESVAAATAKQAGIPSYDTLALHDYEGGDDFAFQVIEKLPGVAIAKWLESHPEDEDLLVRKMGTMMAKIHEIGVTGYGPFDNIDSNLVGRHETLSASLQAGLDFNLDVLIAEGVVQANKREQIERLFDESNQLLQSGKSVLVHNDFADWNLLTDGENITGVLDWDECVASDPVADIACWSTFFDPTRMEPFLEGYWGVTEKPDDFDEKFELFRLRYVLSKMTLRIRRYNWEPTDFMKEKIEVGRVQLADSMNYFSLNEEKL